MKKTRWCATIFFCLSLAFVLGQKNNTDKAKSPAQAQSLAVLQDRLKLIDLRWEILQKDNPPQVDSGAFRFSVAESRNFISQNKLSEAEPKIAYAEGWLNQNEERYYLAHLRGIKEGQLKEDPALLWNEAEKLWSKEADSFMKEDKDAAALYGKAAYEEAGLAGESAIVSELPTAQKITYCFKLWTKHNTVLDDFGALEWKNRAKSLIDRRVELLQKQINWCLAGTVPMCDPTTIRISEDDYRKARKIIEDSWSEEQQLVKIWNQDFPQNKYMVTDLGPAIQKWTRELDDYFSKMAASAKPQTIKDFETQQREERARQKAIVDQYNRLYCGKDSEDTAKLGLRLTASDMKIENGKLMLRLLLENQNSEPVFKPRVRLCGGVVSDELDLGYDRFAGNYQASFSITGAAYMIQSEDEKGYKIMPFWGFITFKDEQGKQLAGKAVIKP